MSARKGRPRDEAIPLGERLLSKSIPEPNSGCWLWEGAPSVLGYGFVVVGSRGKDRQRMLAHRAAWLVAHGDLPSGMFVCHRCDNPACINPDHLFLGTHTDNMRDMAAKGRLVLPPRPTGAEHPLSKFTDEQVREIAQRLVANRETYAAIAKDYGVTESAIGPINRGETYAHVTGFQIRPSLGKGGRRRPPLLQRALTGESVA